MNDNTTRSLSRWLIWEPGEGEGGGALVVFEK